MSFKQTWLATANCPHEVQRRRFMFCFLVAGLIAQKKKQDVKIYHTYLKHKKNYRPQTIEVANDLFATNRAPEAAMNSTYKMGYLFLSAFQTFLKFLGKDCFHNGYSFHCELNNEKQKRLGFAKASERNQGFGKMPFTYSASLVPTSNSKSPTGKAHRKHNESL